MLYLSTVLPIAFLPAVLVLPRAFPRSLRNGMLLPLTGNFVLGLLVGRHRGGPAVGGIMAVTQVGPG